MKTLRLLEALTCSGREDGLSCPHAVKPPLTHSCPRAHTFDPLVCPFVLYMPRYLNIHAVVVWEQTDTPQMALGYMLPSHMTCYGYT